jgi:hypothetical protein
MQTKKMNQTIDINSEFKESVRISGDGRLSLEQVGAVVAEVLGYYDYRAAKVRWATLGFTLLSGDHFLMRHKSLVIIQKALPGRFHEITLVEGASRSVWDWADKDTVAGTVWGCQSLSIIFSDYFVHIAALKLICPTVKNLIDRIVRFNFKTSFKRRLLRVLSDHGDPLHPVEELSLALRKVSLDADDDDGDEDAFDNDQ